uniref:Flavin-containing monooxygenase n=1 Tax=Lygus hesperus TaxID=30085 RepID=A0A0K8SGJ9_LYGHE
MYKNLRTNLPKELMLMEGLDYKTQDRSYLNHTEVLDYLNDYVVKFDLKKVIKFETKVTNVVRSPDDILGRHFTPSSFWEQLKLENTMLCLFAMDTTSYRTHLSWREQTLSKDDPSILTPTGYQRTSLDRRSSSSVAARLGGILPSTWRLTSKRFT